ncbi:putative radical SAM protein [Paratrimastix pyriformis]|uniref:Radical SAM protein n=1 Tax=Paratrimastix pyriformis TaxID=342808 RepID=A0ABQ8UCH0_9EUKA|nr:putative radical SAM protein [Paratrimastix pyriformis]
MPRSFASWKRIRPDAVNILSNELVRGALPRYCGILERRFLPKWHIAKLFGVQLPLPLAECSLEVLWKSHDDVLPAFVEFLRSCDRQVAIGQLAAPPPISSSISSASCGVDRTQRPGACHTQNTLVASHNIHLGEEPEVVPSYTVFFAGCNLHCVFCQNSDISQPPEGSTVCPGTSITPVEMAAILSGAFNDVPEMRNVNWVGGDPTPHIPFILDTLQRLDGTAVPLPSLFNSNMYMSEEAMRLLAGTQDVFLTDWKYGSDDCALRLSKVPRFVEVVERNHILAKQQAELIVRHLVMPSHVECCTRVVAGRVASVLGCATRFNLMFQYRPEFEADIYPEINRPSTKEEERRAKEVARSAGLNNLSPGIQCLVAGSMNDDDWDPVLLQLAENGLQVSPPMLARHQELQKSGVDPSIIYQELMELARLPVEPPQETLCSPSPERITKRPLPPPPEPRVGLALLDDADERLARGLEMQLDKETKEVEAIDPAARSPSPPVLVPSAAPLGIADSAPALSEASSTPGIPTTSSPVVLPADLPADEVLPGEVDQISTEGLPAPPPPGISAVSSPPPPPVATSTPPAQTTTVLHEDQPITQDLRASCPLSDASPECETGPGHQDGPAVRAASLLAAEQALELAGDEIQPARAEKPHAGRGLIEAATPPLAEEAREQAHSPAELEFERRKDGEEERDGARCGAAAEDGEQEQARTRARLIEEQEQEQEQERARARLIEEQELRDAEYAAQVQAQLEAEEAQERAARDEEDCRQQAEKDEMARRLREEEQAAADGEEDADDDDAVDAGALADEEYRRHATQMEDEAIARQLSLAMTSRPPQSSRELASDERMAAELERRLQSEAMAERKRQEAMSERAAYLLAQGLAEGQQSGPLDDPPSAEIEAVAWLTHVQRAAVRHVIERSSQAHRESFPSLLRKIKSLRRTDFAAKMHSKIKSLRRTEDELRTTLRYIRDEAPKWEKRIFGGAYPPECPPFDRCKYGVLNVLSDPAGVASCRQYGDCYLQLKNVRLRCTFASCDTSVQTVRLASCEYYAHVLDECTMPELEAVLDVANKKRVFAASTLFGQYKEVQVHGEIQFGRDVAAIVVDSNVTPAQRRAAEEFAHKNHCEQFTVPGHDLE